MGRGASSEHDWREGRTSEEPISVLFVFPLFVVYCLCHILPAPGTVNWPTQLKVRERELCCSRL